MTAKDFLIKSGNSNNYIFTYELPNDTNKYTAILNVSELKLLENYKNQMNLTFTKAIYDLQKSFEDAILHQPQLAQQTLLQLESPQQQKEASKTLSAYHPDAPIKYLLKHHAIFKTERLQSAPSLLMPNLQLRHDNDANAPNQWYVYLLARKGSYGQEHAMIAVEGLFGCGQRLLKVAHLIAEQQGFFKNHAMQITYFQMEFEKLKHYLPENFHILPIPASRKQAKAILHDIQSNIGELPGKYKSIILNSSSTLSQEDKEKITKNCLTWALEKINDNLGLQLQHFTGAVPSHTVLRLLSEHPEWVPKPSSTPPLPNKRL